MVAMNVNTALKILELDQNATLIDIKKNYLKLVRIWHPDKNKPEDKEKCEAKFSELHDAYTLLTTNRHPVINENDSSEDSNISEYDLSVMSNSKPTKENIIEFDCTQEVFKWAFGLGNNRKIGTSPWIQFSDNFPRNNQEILRRKNELILEILIVISKSARIPVTNYDLYRYLMHVSYSNEGLNWWFNAEKAVKKVGIDSVIPELIQKFPSLERGYIDYICLDYYFKRNNSEFISSSLLVHIFKYMLIHCKEIKNNKFMEIIADLPTSKIDMVMKYAFIYYEHELSLIRKKSFIKLISTENSSTVASVANVNESIKALRSRVAQIYYSLIPNVSTLKLYDNETLTSTDAKQAYKSHSLIQTHADLCLDSIHGAYKFYLLLANDHSEDAIPDYLLGEYNEERINCILTNLDDEPLNFRRSIDNILQYLENRMKLDSYSNENTQKRLSYALCQAYTFIVRSEPENHSITNLFSYSKASKLEAVAKLKKQILEKGFIDRNALPDAVNKGILGKIVKFSQKNLANPLAIKRIASP